MVDLSSRFYQCSLSVVPFFKCVSAYNNQIGIFFVFLLSSGLGHWVTGSTADAQQNHTTGYNTILCVYLFLVQLKDVDSQ